MTDFKKKSIIIYRKKLLLAVVLLFAILAGFLGYRWYKVSHPYSYVSFTTFAPRGQQPQDIMLHLQGYHQDIFHMGDSYLPKKISLTYTLPEKGVLVTQTKSTARTLEELQCSQETNTEDCTLVKPEHGQSFIELRNNSDNSDGHVQAIFLQKETTLIRIQPTNVDEVIPNTEWQSIITAFTNLEAKSFQKSPYRFFDSWNI